MKLPYLRQWDVTPVVVSITEGLTDEGEQKIVATYTGKCSYSEKARTIRNPDGQLIQLSGYLTIGCDIAPSVEHLTGYVKVNGADVLIHIGHRPRNPDGTVNHTKLELV